MSVVQMCQTQVFLGKQGKKASSSSQKRSRRSSPSGSPGREAADDSSSPSRDCELEKKKLVQLVASGIEAAKGALSVEVLKQKDAVVIKVKKSNGVFRADVDCPLCTSTTSFDKRGGRWIVSNFICHLKKRHGSDASKKQPVKRKLQLSSPLAAAFKRQASSSPMAVLLEEQAVDDVEVLSDDPDAITTAPPSPAHGNCVRREPAQPVARRPAQSETWKWPSQRAQSGSATLAPSGVPRGFPGAQRTVEVHTAVVHSHSSAAKGSSGVTVAAGPPAKTSGSVAASSVMGASSPPVQPSSDNRPTTTPGSPSFMAEGSFCLDPDLQRVLEEAEADVGVGGGSSVQTDESFLMGR